MFLLEQNSFIVLSLLIVLFSMIFYAIDKFSIIFKSIIILTSLLLIFSVFPFMNEKGENLLGPQAILNGFSNTSLITVLCLLILGQGVVKTRILDNFVSVFLEYFPKKPKLIIVICLFFVLFLSAFLNNTPVVIIFIPIIQGIVKNLDTSIGKFMMPLSFVAILGGMTTLIGSSTNLLVSNSLRQYADVEIGFFEMTAPGLIIAISGFLFIVFFSKFFLTDRSPLSNKLVEDSENHFITQVFLNENSTLIGQSPKDGIFPGLEEVKVLMLQRGEHAEHGPFDNLVLEKGDLLVISSSREALTSILSKNIAFINPEHRNERIEGTESSHIIAEAMITPSSSLVGNTIENISFRYRYNCLVIGLQRKSKIITRQMSELPLETGDILLIQGSKDSIKNLRNQSDILPMEWATSEIFQKDVAYKSLYIFLIVILLGAFEILPLVVSALIGVVSMIIFGVLSIRQVIRNIDNNLLLLIVTSLALGNIIQVTGTATFLSNSLLGFLSDSSTMTIISCFFIFVSITTNFISNNACAVLFTPVAIDLSLKLGVDPKIFAIALIFAVNTSFITPLAYQTNLLVMGPGHYKFVDYIKFGLPLTIVCWIAFIISFPIMFEL